MLLSAVMFTTTDIVVGKTPTKETKAVKYEHDVNCDEVTNAIANHLDECMQGIKEREEESHWKSIGLVRCTEYCTSCNSPSGHHSSSGTYLTDGHVACSWLSLGTRIRINGYEFIVVDTCGTDAIDIFRDRDDGCYCNMNEYKEVEVYVP